MALDFGSFASEDTTWSMSNVLAHSWPHELLGHRLLGCIDPWVRKGKRELDTVCWRWLGQVDEGYQCLLLSQQTR